jgi:hypothetical protein
MALEHRAYLYALITREHRKTGESVVKYGMTSVGLAKRMAKYPKDSLMLGACPVDTDLVAVAEAALLKAAKQRFRQCCTEGRESFKGDIDAQVAMLYDIGKRFRPELRLPVATSVPPSSSSSSDEAVGGEDHTDGEVQLIDRPSDMVARVHAFKTEVCDTEYVGTEVPLLDVHARYLEWLGVTGKRPTSVRRLCAELRRNFGIRSQASSHGAVVSFKTHEPASCKSALAFLARSRHNTPLAVAKTPSVKTQAKATPLPGTTDQNTAAYAIPIPN